jgi:hypothetical protein
MYPIRKKSRVAALVVVAALLTVGTPHADAHGGGGGHGSGHGRGGGAGGPSGAYYHAYPTYHGYNSSPYYWRGPGSQPTMPVLEGFPEDLPFARLQRFFASHLHRLHLPGRPVG